MKSDEISALMRGVATVIKEQIGAVLASFTARFATVDQRIEALAAEKAERGEKGDRGDDGRPGASAFDIARGAGFSGTESEWLEALRAAPAQVPTEAVEALIVLRAGERFEPFAANIDSLTQRLVDVEERAAVPGPQGEPGEPGEAGPRGEAGERGADGAQGERGMDGDAGAQGERGEQGPRGELGERGLAGDDGKDGAPGERGQDGTVGERGERGERGADGAPGKDIDEAALQLRIDAAVEKAVAAGVAKAMAELVLPKDGAPGVDGKDGQDGRDALQIELLDAIDPAKSYPRGTFARWNGGTVRSFRATDALVDGEPLEKSGWSLAQDGLASIGAESVGDDPRDLVIRATMTSGRTIEHAVSVPTPVWKGTWAADGQYRQGDEVTYDGSIWHCERPTKAKPGTQTSTPDWKLCVKRGRDGKDGDKGAKGDRGEDGRAGRDLTQLSFNGGKT